MDDDAHLPPDNDASAWQEYWRSFGARYLNPLPDGDGELWRREPLIKPDRQTFLRERLAVQPSIPDMRFPLKGVALTRADIEWLLDTHDQGRGPVDGQDPEQRERTGLDLRGADLSNLDLSRLPLAGLRGGLTDNERITATTAEEEAAAVRLNNAQLYHAYLQWSQLAGAQLEGADLARARLQGAHLAAANLTRVDLRAAHLEGAMLEAAILEGADLTRAHLDDANMRWARCENADLKFALLFGVDLREVHFESADLTRAHLEGADLRLCFFDSATTLDRVYFCDKVHGCALLADIHWSDVNLSLIEWSSVHTLTGKWPRRREDPSIRAYVTHREQSIAQYDEAVRANRQLAIVLYNQGLNEEGARFSQAAYIVRRRLYRLRRRYIRWMLSWIISALAGYGHAPGRTVAWYVAIISICALLYWRLGSPDPIVESFTAFHGRGFFIEQYKLGNPEYRIAAAEAVIGLLIEICFIATFTQRFLGRGSDN
ncbi:MAG TPA: pentapeptide repeat-containing protein [Ktedonobacterales bacterium]|nr:pentapeptide repeat-containing protein [Ktedonobacterales bacterium]